MEQEHGLEEEVVVKHDQHHIVSLRAQENYYSDLINKKLLLERGIELDKVVEILPNFYQWLENSELIYFVPKPCRANQQWVRDFYANLMETNMSTRLITFRGEVVNYGQKRSMQ